MTQLLNEKAAAHALGLQPKTLTRWRWEGRGPPHCKIGGAVRYRVEDVEAFIAGTVVQNG
jgi:predicted DNA-binding transcriptional regulator AlpA